jgi:hypothetical protein
MLMFIRIPLLLLCFLFSANAHGGNFLEGDLFEFALGPGFQAGTNIRNHSTLKSQESDHYSGAIPLYNVRLGPISITNTYEVQEFTKGKGFRIGALLTVRGEPYEAQGVDRKRESLFGGGFFGYKALTIFSYSDLLSRNGGSVFTLALTPALYETKTSSLFLIFDAEHMNFNYVTYYFGISPQESSTLLPTYSGKATTNFSGRIAYRNQFAKYASFLLWAGEKHYGKGITESPTVGKRWEFSCGFGFLLGLL